VALLIWQISVAVITVAFVILVVYLIQTLKSVTALVDKTNEAVNQMQQQINQISTDASELLKHTNEITVDVRDKLHALDNTFYSIKNIGDAVSEITYSVKQVSATVTDTIQHKVQEELKAPKSPFNKILPFIPVVIDIVRKIKK
jgi:uncharacterized protein YoxC